MTICSERIELCLWCRNICAHCGCVVSMLCKSTDSESKGLRLYCRAYVLREHRVMPMCRIIPLCTDNILRWLMNIVIWYLNIVVWCFNIAVVLVCTCVYKCVYTHDNISNKLGVDKSVLILFVRCYSYGGPTTVTLPLAIDRPPEIWTQACA